LLDFEDDKMMAITTAEPMSSDMGRDKNGVSGYADGCTAAPR
jgi:hypothetical protein